jgi:hypothetical protein
VITRTSPHGSAYDPQVQVKPGGGGTKKKITRKKHLENRKKTPVAEGVGNVFVGGSRNGTGNVKGTSGWLKDTNGDGKISLYERILSVIKLLGRVPEFLTQDEPLLWLPVIAGVILFGLNAQAWTDGARMKGFYPILGLIVCVFFTFAQSFDDILTLGPRGKVKALVKASTLPGLLPQLNLDLNPEGIAAFNDFRSSQSGGARKGRRTKMIFLCLLEVFALCTISNPFANGIDVVTLILFFTIVFGVPVCILIYGFLLSNLMTQDQKDCVNKIMGSYGTKTVRV